MKKTSKPKARKFIPPRKFNPNQFSLDEIPPFRTDDELNAEFGTPKTMKWSCRFSPTIHAALLEKYPNQQVKTRKPKP